MVVWAFSVRILGIGNLSGFFQGRPISIFGTGRKNRMGFLGNGLPIQFVGSNPGLENIRLFSEVKTILKTMAFRDLEAGSVTTGIC
jgi:hypothetical protein